MGQNNCVLDGGFGQKETDEGNELNSNNDAGFNSLATSNTASLEREPVFDTLETATVKSSCCSYRHLQSWTPGPDSFVIRLSHIAGLSDIPASALVTTRAAISAEGGAFALNRNPA